MLITTLVDAGVAEDAAIDRVGSTTLGDDKATFMEMYGQVASTAKQIGQGAASM